MLISNIWGIWPEERSLDDKTSPVSLGPSYACLYTGYWPDCCSLPPTASAPKFLPPHTHSAAYHLPSGSSCLVGMQWHRTVVWISASPRIRDAEHTFVIFWPTFHLLWKNVYLRIGLNFYQGIHSAAAKLWQFNMKFTCWPLLRPSSVSS